jgi:hypothetical protein
MKLKQTISKKEMELAGISMDVVLDGSSIKRLILQDANGKYLELSLENYNVRAFVIAPPQMKDVWKVSGEINGVKFGDTFDNEYMAKATFDRFDAMTGVSNLVNEKIAVPVEE